MQSSACCCDGQSARNCVLLRFAPASAVDCSVATVWLSWCTNTLHAVWPILNLPWALLLLTRTICNWQLELVDGASVLIRLCDGRRADELPSYTFPDLEVGLWYMYSPCQTVFVTVYIFQFRDFCWPACGASSQVTCVSMCLSGWYLWN